MRTRVSSAVCRSCTRLLYVTSASLYSSVRAASDSSSTEIFWSRLLIFCSSTSRISCSCCSRSSVDCELSRLRCLYLTSSCSSWKFSLLGSFVCRWISLLRWPSAARILSSVSRTAACSACTVAGNDSMKAVISWSFSCSFWYLTTSSCESAPRPDSIASSSCCACLMRPSTSAIPRSVTCSCLLSSFTCARSCSRCSASLSAGLFASASSARRRSSSCLRCSSRAWYRCL
mmetsp:Transcript_12624/g.34885  ORF Transcript_12624/g.34885 Transcript_12624/m.34885 type:complete len:231 (-) Transcript_12624:999-1691(-)